MLWTRKKTPPAEIEKIPPAERFNDPHAAETKWTPILEGGYSFRSHTLLKVHSERLEFRIAKLRKFVLGGLCIFFISFVPVTMLNVITGRLPGSPDIYLMVFGGTFIMLFILGRALYKHSTPIVFDKHKGYFWLGRKPPYDAPNTDQLEDACHLRDIHALQLISKKCNTNQGKFDCYELNLVLHDGGRINVICHGDLVHIREDAEVLADFLDVPLWDAIPG